MQSGGRDRGSHIRAVSHTLLTPVPCPIPDDVQLQRGIGDIEDSAMVEGTM